MDKWCGNFWHSQMMISVYVYDVLNWFDCCSFAFAFLKFELSLFYFGKKEFQRANESSWVEFLCLSNFFFVFDKLNSTSEMILQNEHAIFLLSFELELIFLFSKNLSIRSRFLVWTLIYQGQWLNFLAAYFHEISFSRFIISFLISEPVRARIAATATISRNMSNKFYANSETDAKYLIA